MKFKIYTFVDIKIKLNIRNERENIKNYLDKNR